MPLSFFYLVGKLFIQSIDDVLPHIEGRDEFIVAKRDGYTVIDYQISLPDSFDDPIRRECRGLKFNPEGRLIARPLSKFFNISERPDTQPHLIDFTKPHVITEKLDGSMIHPAEVNGEMVFMTRMGVSQQALEAKKLFMTNDMIAGCWLLLSLGITPIFEYTGPDNRIVIPYAAPALTLIAVRWTMEGTYFARTKLQTVADTLGVPLVPNIAPEWQDCLAFLDFTRALIGQEGFVLWFDPGAEKNPSRQILKCKGNDYCLKHRAKESIGLEKNVLALILQNGLDDVMPLLSDIDRARVESYRDNVQAGMHHTIERIDDLVSRGRALDQKTFAVEHLKDVPQPIRSLALAARRSENSAAEVRNVLLKNLGSQTRVDGVRSIFDAQF